MEGCGLILALPFTLLTSLVFCGLAHKAFLRWPQVRHVASVVAVLVVSLLVIEIAFLLRIGPFHLHERLGRSFWTVHMVGFLLGPPAIAVLVITAVWRFASVGAIRVGLATFVCWLACMATLVWNIMVDEDVSGIDGSGSRPTQSIFPP